MTGEGRIARGALIGSAAIGLPATLLAALLGGPKPAWSVGLAVAVIAGNLGLAVAFASFASRFQGLVAMALSLPGFAIRLGLSLLALTALRGRTFIDERVFVAVFCVALTAVLFLQARSWKRTPWLAHALSPSTKEIA